jgi:signal transduction histidine kinase
MDQPVPILLVDDEPRNLDALEAILASPSYHLIRALSGDEALRALLRNDVAAIVLDIRMPDVSGVELAQLIKSNRKFSEIPILFLTAYVFDDREVAAGYGAGAVDYLVKPVNPIILRHKIAVFADLFRKTRALAELNETLEARVQERTAELERSEAALRESARQKDEFLATLAHELRNPLAPLRMGLHLLMRKAPDECGQTLAVMNRQLGHMVRLIDDLLDVARISRGKIELKKERTNLADVTQTAIETSRPFFEQRRQVLATELDRSLWAFADPTRVAQVVGNLLHNASKFTPEHGHVSVVLSYEAPNAVIRVVDAGAGIDSARLLRVFDMFTSSTKPGSSPTGGLGIGLALSRRLAQMHDGNLTLTSEGVGLGTQATFSLPAEPSAAVELSPTVVEGLPRAPRSSPAHVLIIEDNQDSAQVLAQALQAQGYCTTVANDGRTGLARARSIRPRIVLCDIGLPEMDGTEVCRSLRRAEPDYAPVMIALTGWGQQEDVRRTREAGFDHHLVKPVDPERLLQLLDSIE